MNKNMPTLYQKSIVIGLILGDGYLYKNGRLQVEQSYKHKEYVIWLYNQLHTLASGKISKVTRTHSKTKKQSTSYRFYTKKLFKDLESIFYTTKVDLKRKKIIPKNLKQLLNSTVLSIWFMDDGGKSQSTVKGAYINATSFSHEERLQIQKAFYDVFKIKINIHKAGGNKQYNFYVPANLYFTFYEIVSPIVLCVPSMTYKLSIIVSKNTEK